ncbi:PREDICTED: germin-like protein subfamily 1 member 5 [Camelina sativa]|uniref:Germin-like protein n=1 Tax=Camelina sativa TaxID=90675 RepID=A0ABM0W0A7_CAMSA|nr:PREDICTED: germin-like protein subfamily 1 member 5 [Camelina sativa]
MEGRLRILAKIVLLALASSFVYCYDPSPLQDYCVAVDDIHGVFVNGKFCKDPKRVTANDFYTSGLNVPGNTSTGPGSTITAVTVERMPGLNTLGVGIARIDMAPGGQVPPHTHPRASEILLVIKGKLFVGFVSSNEYNYTLFTKVLYPGDVFVSPKGLIQFHANIGKTNAVVIAAAGSQEPGRIVIGDAVFGSNPLIDPNLLAKAFALKLNKVKYLQAVFSSQDDLRDYP